MAHFAEVKNGIVQRVIVAEQDFIDSGAVGPKENWVQTSYNTHANVHAKGNTPLRKNYAGKGMIYDSVRDAFLHKQPYPSWTLNEETGDYDPPTPMPASIGLSYWDESKLNWVTRG